MLYNIYIDSKLKVKYGGTKSYLPHMSVLFVFTIIFFDLQKFLHLIFIQWNKEQSANDNEIEEEDISSMPLKKLRWMHNHRKVMLF